MALADAIKRRIDKALTKLNPTDRVVSKRVLTREGGDPVTGRAGTVTVVDTVLVPQPSVSQIGAGDRILLVSTVARVGDYLLVISASALSRDDFRNKDLALVLKDSSSEEELFVVAVDPSVIGGQCVAFQVVARSKRR